MTGDHRRRASWDGWEWDAGDARDAAVPVVRGWTDGSGRGGAEFQGGTAFRSSRPRFACSSSLSIDMVESVAALSERRNLGPPEIAERQSRR